MKTILKTLVIMSIISFAGCAGNDNPTEWTDDELNEWYEEGEWREGLEITPSETIDKRAFAEAYHKNPERWDKAFAFVKEENLDGLDAERYDIMGDTLFAMISEYPTKKEEDANYEAHRKYADIQYVINGNEQIGIVPVEEKDEVFEEYDDSRDIEFFSVKEGKNYEAAPDRFFIFFPGNAHKPGLRDADSTMVKKLVIKVKLD